MSEEFEHKTVPLERLEVYISERFHDTELQSVSFEGFDLCRSLADKCWYGVARFGIPAEKLGSQTVHYPATWWDHLKRDVVIPQIRKSPRWVRRWLLRRVKPLTFTAETVELRALYKDGPSFPHWKTTFEVSVRKARHD